MFALLLFIALMIAGRYLDRLSWRGIAVCLGFVAATITLFVTFDWQPRLLTAVFAVLDIILVLIVFRGDVRIR